MKFSALDEDTRDLFSIMWCSSIPFLGLRLLQELPKYVRFRYRLGIGANPETSVAINKNIFAQITGKLSHYYMLQQRQDGYLLAKPSDAGMPEEVYSNSMNEHKVFWQQVNTVEELSSYYNFDREKEQIPYKDIYYIKKWYLEHPVYSYEVYIIWDTVNKDKKPWTSGHGNAILVLREQEYSGRKALRVVDYIGEQKIFGMLKDFFCKRLEDWRFEYADFYNYGIKKQYILEAGFKELLEEDETVIPTYYEPFVQKNVDIWFHAPVEQVRFCKADGHQDRPNNIHIMTEI